MIKLVTVKMWQVIWMPPNLRYHRCGESDGHSAEPLHINTVRFYGAGRKSHNGHACVCSVVGLARPCRHHVACVVPVFETAGEWRVSVTCAGDCQLDPFLDLLPVPYGLRPSKHCGKLVIIVSTRSGSEQARQVASG